jgi:hypothetical protein
MYKYFLLIVLLFNSNSWAMNVDEIIEKANKASYYQGKDGSAHVKMKIIDSSGRKRSRSFVILRKNAKGLDQNFFVYFKRPSDVKKTTFLVHKHAKKDDDRWLYLPSLDLVKRISAGDERTSFVGSNFYYEDVSGRNPNKDKHELVKTTKYYVIKNTPIDKSKVEFAYYKAYIGKDNFIPEKIEYFNNKDKLYREYNALKIETVSGFPTVVKSVMKDIERNEKTEIKYSKVKYNIGVPERIFTERYLKAAPKRWLK